MCDLCKKERAFYDRGTYYICASCAVEEYRTTQAMQKERNKK